MSIRVKGRVSTILNDCHGIISVLAQSPADWEMIRVGVRVKG